MPSNVASKPKTRRPKRQSGSRNGKEVAKFAGDAYSLAERAYKGVSHVLKLINIESKVFDITITATYNSGNINSSLLTTIPQGVDTGNRVGDSIKFQSIEISYGVLIPNALTYQNIRIVLFKDMDPTGTLPTYTDVFTNGNAVAPRNFFTLRRFVILHDESIAIQPVSFTGVNTKLVIPQTAHCKWKTNAATMASLAEGHVFVFFFSDGASVFPTTTFFARFLYTDD
jgi:hypothetical protein